MIRSLIILSILLTIIFPDLASGQFRLAGEKFNPQNTTGTITQIRKHKISIIEDGSHKKITFLYMRRDIDRFQSGERVRIYFRKRYEPVISIKKLTLLEYKRNQNLGFITGEPK